MLHLQCFFCCCCCLEAKGQYCLNTIFCTSQAFFFFKNLRSVTQSKIDSQCIFLTDIYLLVLFLCLCFMTSIACIVWANRTQKIEGSSLSSAFCHYTHTSTCTLGVLSICPCLYKLLTVSELGLNYNCIVLISQYEGCAI